MEWLWIALFGSFVSLSDQATSLQAGTYDLPLKSPLSAITPGAALYVDITQMVPKDEMTVDGSRRWSQRSIVPGCIKATLVTDVGTTVAFEFKGAISFAPDSLYLIVSSAEPAIPLRQDFNKLTVSSCMALHQVRFYWANHRK